jgi:hypothetical protein
VNHNRHRSLSLAPIGLLTLVVGLLTAGYGVFCLVTGHQDTSGSPIGGIIVGSVLAAGGFGLWWYDHAPVKAQTKRRLVGTATAIAILGDIGGCLYLAQLGLGIILDWGGLDRYASGASLFAAFVFAILAVCVLCASISGLTKLSDYVCSRIKPAPSKL